jgi:hypothetical protein
MKFSLAFGVLEYFHEASPVSPLLPSWVLILLLKGENEVLLLFFSI